MKFFYALGIYLVCRVVVPPAAACLLFRDETALQVEGEDLEVLTSQLSIPYRINIVSCSCHKFDVAALFLCSVKVPRVAAPPIFCKCPAYGDAFG